MTKCGSKYILCDYSDKKCKNDEVCSDFTNYAKEYCEVKAPENNSGMSILIVLLSIVLMIIL